MRYPDSRRAVPHQRSRRFRLVRAECEAITRAGDIIRITCGIERTPANVRPHSKRIRAGVSHFQLRVLLILECDDVDAMRASGQRQSSTNSAIGVVHSIPNDNLHTVDVHHTPAPESAPVLKHSHIQLSTESTILSFFYIFNCFFYCSYFYYFFLRVRLSLFPWHSPSPSILSLSLSLPPSLPLPPPPLPLPLPLSLPDLSLGKHHRLLDSPLRIPCFVCLCSVLGFLSYICFTPFQRLIYGVTFQHSPTD